MKRAKRKGEVRLARSRKGRKVECVCVSGGGVKKGQPKMEAYLKRIKKKTGERMQGWKELSVNTDIKLYYLSIKLLIIVKQQQKGRLSFCLFVLKSDSVSSCVNALCTDLEFLLRATNNPKLFSSSHGWMLQGDVCVCACLYVCVCVCARARVLHLIRSLFHLQENNAERQGAGWDEKWHWYWTFVWLLILFI